MISLRRLPTTLLALAALVAAATTARSASDDTGELITLEQAIQRAIARNFTIQSSGLDVSIARARVLEQFGLFDPQLTGTYSTSEAENPLLTLDPATGRRNTTGERSDTYELSLNGTLPWGLTYTLGATEGNTRGTFNLFADNYATFAGVSARQPLLRGFGFGATTAQLRIAMTNRSLTEWQFKQSVIDTVTRVIFAYHELNFAHGVLRATRRAHDIARQLVDDNDKRFRVGSMSEYDVTSARARLANRVDDILFAERGVREAANAFKALISDERTMALHDWSVRLEPPAALPVVLVNPALDFKDALNRRPDYQQALLNLQRSRITQGYQRNQLLPRVDLVGSYGHAGLDADRSTARRLVREQDHRAYSWGVQVTVPLTFAAERGRYRAARFAARQAETELQQIEQDIVVAVGNSAANIDTARRRVDAARAARELGQATLDAEEKRLRAGTGNTFFVVQQQEILASLEVAELRAEADYRKAVAEYDRQLGLTLEKLAIEVAAPR